MALQLWMPFTKDYRNQGLSYTVPTHSGGEFLTNGKMGTCLHTTNGCSIDTLETYDKWNFGSGSVSFGGWFKFNQSEIYNAIKGLSYNAITTPTGNLLGYSSYGGFALIWQGNNLDSGASLTNFRVYPGIRTNGGISNASAHYPTYDTWTHYFTVFDKTVNCLSFYVNGSFYSSASTIAFSDSAYTHNNFKINAANVWGGNGPTASIPLYVNDVRMYNHAVSEKDVKEIAMGLAMHNNGGDMFMGNTVNLGNTSSNYSNMNFGTVYTASSWEGDAGTVTYYKNGGYSNYPYKVYHKTATGTGGIFKKTDNDISIVSGKTYTMSIYVKASRNFTADAYSFNINGTAGSDTNHYINYGKSFNITTEWQRLVRTFTAGTADTGTYGEMSIVYNDDVADYYIYYSGFQIEEGSEATPYTQKSRVGLAPDWSGMGHGGVPYSMKTSGSSLYFGGTESSIKIPFKETTNGCGEFTVNLWINKDAVGSESWETILGGPSGFEVEGKRSATPTIVAYNWGQSQSGGTTYSLNTWNMVTFARNASATYWYMNGVLKYTLAAGTIPSGNYFWGAWNTYTGQNYKGYMQDMKVFSKVLTQTEITELYSKGHK